MRQDGTQDMSPPDRFKWTIGRNVQTLDWVHEAELCILEIKERVKAIKGGEAPLEDDFYDWLNAYSCGYFHPDHASSESSDDHE